MRARVAKSAGLGTKELDVPRVHKRRYRLGLQSWVEQTTRAAPVIVAKIARLSQVRSSEPYKLGLGCSMQLLQMCVTR